MHGNETYCTHIPAQWLSLFAQVLVDTMNGSAQPVIGKFCDIVHQDNWHKQCLAFDSLLSDLDQYEGSMIVPFKANAVKPM